MAEREGWTKAAADWAQVVSALVGAVAAYAAFVIGQETLEQGKQQDQEAKTIQSLEFFATFTAPLMLEIRRGLSNEDWCVRYGYLDDEDYVSQVSADQILIVVDFFDAVHNSCFVQDLCNQTFSRQLFHPYAKDFYDELSKSILDFRTNGGRDDSFGQGIAMLAHQSAALEGAGEGPPLQEVVARYATESCNVPSPTSP